MTDKDREAFETKPMAGAHLVAYGYAHGCYMCRCLECNRTFAGDKRASKCLHCAMKLHEQTARAQPEVKSFATCKHHDNASYQPLSVEAYTALAHRIASRYRHDAKFALVEYTFQPHTLGDFVRAIEAAHGIKEQA